MTFSQNNGRTFVDFMKIEEQAIQTHQPLGGSFAVIEHDSHFLLCYNIWRCQWEIPAGKREENETPKECAARELLEETGQQVGELQFVGLLKSHIIRTSSVQYNPVYYGHAHKLDPFVENQETSAIILWNRQKDIGIIDEVDRQIFDYIKR